MSDVTVRRLIRRGELPAVQLGPKGAPVRIDSRELESWLYDDPAFSPFGAGDPAARPAPGTRPAVEAERSAAGDER